MTSEKKGEKESRQFFEVIGRRDAEANFVEKADPEFRKAPTEHHIFVRTKTPYRSMMQFAGWLDQRTHSLRPLTRKTDVATVRAILAADGC